MNKNAIDFDKGFLSQQLMGPNCIRHIDEITQKIRLTPEMRILDLGCGNGLTSMYLAKKYGSQVFAADLWIDPTDNFERFKQFGLDAQIVPVRAEAHELPFAKNYFDAVVSVDAYHYFGAEPDYLDKHLAPLVKRGGIIAISVPGLLAEFPDEIPDILQPYVKKEFHFHSVAWWKSHWQHSEKVEMIDAFSLKCHKDAWEDWLQTENPYAVDDRPMMVAEGGNYFDTVGVIAKVTAE